MRHPTRARALLAAVSISAALIGACGRGSGSPESHDPVPAARLPVDVRAELAPASDRDALIRAEQTLAARCMREQGLGFTISTAREVRASRDWGLLEDAYRYGVPSSARGRDFGLTRSASTAQGAGDDPNAGRLAEMSRAEADAWNASLYGSGSERLSYRDRDGTEYSAPADGCQTKALVRLYGSFGDAMRLQSFSGTFSELVWRRVSSDRRFGEVEARWAACARSRGVDYQHPGEALGEVRGILEAGPSRQAQATEERGFQLVVACEAETNIYELGWSLTRKVLPRVMAEEAGNIAEYRAVVEQARRVLAEDR
jgi:hypothetical protein